MSDSPSDDELDGIDVAHDALENVTTTVSSAYKVLGEIDAPDGTGVLGHNTATSGDAIGVEGVTEATGFTASGVFGEAVGGSGMTFGVYGRTQSAQNQAAGVRGSAQAPTGRVHGVQGFTSSSTTGASGMTGTAVAGSGSTFGVQGRTQSVDSGSAGVIGQAIEETGLAYGVYGRNLSSDTGAAAVVGEAVQGSGQTVGVQGVSNSPEGYGLYTPDDAKVDGALRANRLGLTNTGGAVTRSTTQTIQHDTFTAVEFDQVVADDRNEFDTSTGEFVCAYDGDYEAHAAVMFNGIGYGVRYHTRLRVVDASEGFDGFGATTRHRTADVDGITQAVKSQQVRRTFKDLSAGDKIYVEVWHTDGETVDVLDGDDETFFEVRQVA